MPDPDLTPNLAPTTGAERVAEGERIYLSALDKANIPIVLDWLADPDVNAFILAGHEPMSVEQEEQWYDDVAASATDRVFEIHVADDGRYIGNLGLHKIDAGHRHAEIGLFIGSKPDQNRGLGRDAIVTALRYAFDTLGLHRVYLRCQPGNERALRAYRAIGFVEVGRERESALVDGRYRDHLVFDLLEDEFRSRYGG
jgi:RimJ/RimL family protein N-acetyltransferase